MVVMVVVFLRIILSTVVIVVYTFATSCNGTKYVYVRKAYS